MADIRPKNKIFARDILLGMYLLRDDELVRLGLAGRELEVAQQLLEGIGEDRIARRLRISQSGVKYHLKKIYAKSGRHTRDGFTSLVACRVQESDRSWANRAKLVEDALARIEDHGVRVRHGLVNF